jgi:hypothetical protein
VREIFNLSFMMNSKSRMSPYVVLLCKGFTPQIRGDRLRVLGKKGTMTKNMSAYVKANADMITTDIIAIDAFFEAWDDGLEVD